MSPLLVLLFVFQTLQLAFAADDSTVTDVITSTIEELVTIIAYRFTTEGHLTTVYVTGGTSTISTPLATASSSEPSEPTESSVASGLLSSAASSAASSASSSSLSSQLPTASSSDISNAPLSSDFPSRSKMSAVSIEQPEATPSSEQEFSGTSTHPYSAKAADLTSYYSSSTSTYTEVVAGTSVAVEEVHLYLAQC